MPWLHNQNCLVCVLRAIIMNNWRWFARLRGDMAFAQQLDWWHQNLFGDSVSFTSLSSSGSAWHYSLRVLDVLPMSVGVRRLGVEIRVGGWSCPPSLILTLFLLFRATRYGDRLRSLLRRTRNQESRQTKSIWSPSDQQGKACPWNCTWFGKRPLHSIYRNHARITGKLAF